MKIESSLLSLEVREDRAQVCLASKTFSQASLVSSLSPVINRPGYAASKTQITMREVSPPNTQQTNFGPVTMARFTIAPLPGGVHGVLDVGLCADFPFACLRIRLTNRSDQDIAIKRITLLDCPPGNLLLGNENPTDTGFYSNGWQSWSHTGAYGMGDRQAVSRLGPFQNPMVVNPGTTVPRRKNHFSSDMFGVIGDRQSRVGLLAGFLSQINHFGSLEARLNPKPSLKMWTNGDDAFLRPGDTILTDWAVVGFVDLDSNDPLDDYLTAVARENEVDSTGEVPVGWCSWYYFYQDISEKVIDSNLNSVIEQQSELPLSLFQIDDGFQTYPGDWMDFTPAFPQGLNGIVEKIQSNGLTPGLWLAPFIVHPKAALVKHHPEWLLRNKHGRPVNAGYVWNRFTHALDPTHPGIIDYAAQVIDTAVNDWGFEYLKLDFLYAAALKGSYHDPTQTRAQALRRGLEALRAAAGEEITMLACGCPLGSALGLFEVMRIGADVSGYWQPHFPPVTPLLASEPHMPAARNAIQNILTRAPLHRRWWINDPDCLLVREDTELTLAEVHTLASAIGMTGGSLLVSDDLPALSPDRMDIIKVLLPLIDQRPIVLDWFDARTPARLRVDLDGPAGRWHLLAFFNWKENPADVEFILEDFKLPPGLTLVCREFWSGSIGQLSDKNGFICQQVPPHGVRVIAARPFDPAQPAYIGSDLHLSQGLEIDQWVPNRQSLNLRFNLGRNTDGKVYLYLPWTPASADLDGTPCAIEDLGDGIVSIRLENMDQKLLSVRS